MSTINEHSVISLHWTLFSNSLIASILPDTKAEFQFAIAEHIKRPDTLYKRSCIEFSGILLAFPGAYRVGQGSVRPVEEWKTRKERKSPQRNSGENVRGKVSGKCPRIVFNQVRVCPEGNALWVYGRGNLKVADLL